MKDRTLILHPVLAAIYPVLFLYQHNIERTAAAPRAAMWALIAATISVLLWWALHRWLRDAHRSALLATFGITALFTYGHFWLAWSQLSYLAGYVHLESTSLLVVLPWMVMCALAAFLLYRAGPISRDLTRLANGTLGVLIIVSAVGVGLSAPSGPSAAASAGEAHALEGDRDPADGPKPDVYYIVLDGYARRDVLRDVFGHDNRPFVNELRERGFDVARRSDANYPLTFLSLASTLNMRYLDELPATVPPDSTDERPAVELVRDNAVSRAFHEEGYHITHFDSGYSITQKLDQADEEQICGRFHEFDRTLLRTTLFALVERHIDHADTHARVTCMLDTLERIAATPSEEPRFVFSHIVSPHPPYAFDEDGSYVSPGLADARGQDESYVRQLSYLNDRVMRVVDEILANADTPPVIILQSDHGPAEAGAWDEDDPAFVKARMSTFSAVLAPEGANEALTSTRTNVNTFRAVLSDLFGYDLPPLEDRLMFATYEQPYEWSDVTALVRDEPAAATVSTPS